MEEKIRNYCTQIGVSEPTIERINELYLLQQEICPQNITDLFVSDLRTGQGTREHNDLWFFSEDYSIEILTFISRNYFEIIYLDIFYIGIESLNYTSKKSSEESRLMVNARFNGGTFSNVMRATGNNCGCLFEIMKTYFVPRCKGPQAAYAPSSENTMLNRL